MLLLVQIAIPGGCRLLMVRVFELAGHDGFRLRGLGFKGLGSRVSGLGLWDLG